jgi:hypothetical protein
MAVLSVPRYDPAEPWPTLGPAIADLIEERAIFGPGSFGGQPAVLDDEKRGILYQLYEVHPQGDRLAGRRRFKRGVLELRKGLAKTEFGAWITYAELHPDAPVRFDHWDSDGNPIGKPVRFPYIPMMAVTEGQVSELAYGVLKYIVEEGPDADLFDSGEDRIIRLGDHGQVDGRAVPVANAPGARDGALTSFEYFDEPHRLYLPTHKSAHNTMTANLEKRPLEDPWGLYTSTAGKPGQGSIQEDLHKEAELIDEGKIKDPAMMFFCRWAGDEHDDISTIELRVAAIADATGPSGEYGPGQFEGIAKQWDAVGADLSYLERVWMNRWRMSASQAFDIVQWNRPAAGYEPEGYERVEGQKAGLSRPGEVIPPGAFVAGGFDGARFRDATALVITDIRTGLQELWGLWERPEDLEEWEVPEDEVTELVQELMTRFDVWKIYCDPPHWTETVGAWSVKWPDQIEEFWTAQSKRMAYTIREYLEAWDSGTLGHNPLHPNDADLTRHLGNADRKELRIRDDEDKPLWVMQKNRMDFKFDAAMAATLSGKACLDARRLGATPRRPRKAVIRRLNPTR